MKQRFYSHAPLPEELRPFAADWVGLAAVGWAISVTQRDGKECSDVRYYISSLASGVQRFAEAVRGHWGRRELAELDLGT